MGRPRAVTAGKGLRKIQESLTVKSQISKYPLKPPSDPEAAGKVGASLPSATQGGHAEMGQGKQLAADSREEDQGCRYASLPSEVPQTQGGNFLSSYRSACSEDLKLPRERAGKAQHDSRGRVFGWKSSSASEEAIRSETATLSVKIK